MRWLPVCENLPVLSERFNVNITLDTETIKYPGIHREFHNAGFCIHPSYFLLNAFIIALVLAFVCFVRIAIDI